MEPMESKWAEKWLQQRKWEKENFPVTRLAMKIVNGNKNILATWSILPTNFLTIYPICELRNSLKKWRKIFYWEKNGKTSLEAKSEFWSEMKLEMSFPWKGKIRPKMKIFKEVFSPKSHSINHKIRKKRLLRISLI